MVSEDIPILRDGVISGAGEVTHIPKNLVEKARGHWCEWKQSLELGGYPRGELSHQGEVQLEMLRRVTSFLRHSKKGPKL